MILYVCYEIDALDNFLQVTAQLLLETQAGKKIRKLTKHSNAAVSRAAAATVSAWKEAITQETVSQATSSAGVHCRQLQGETQETHRL